MLLIFTPHITNRIKYAFQLIFTHILNIEVQLTIDSKEFIAYSGPKLSYANNPLDNEIFFRAHSLLFESKVKEQAISVLNWNNQKIFFTVPSPSAFPFDPFAASFYLATRYEEYLPFIPDNYNRYDPINSLAYKHQFLHKPVINQWAIKIKEYLQLHFPQFHFPQNKYEFVPTFDIDNAYAYKAKGFVRTCGAYLKSLIHFKGKEVMERTAVLTGKKKDPYDTYSLQTLLHKKYNLNPIYFFLLGDYGSYDTNISHLHFSYQQLIKILADNANVGIHPSYRSAENPNKLSSEIERLQNILNIPITKSRQHFLKLAFPYSYRNLIKYGITDDYTMGYPSNIGFRAGICTPFYFYDLEKEMKTFLKIHPFQVMDTTLRHYMRLSPEQAVSKIKSIIKEVKAVEGTFICLWHNESLSDTGLWKGWKKVYEEMLEGAI